MKLIRYNYMKNNFTKLDFLKLHSKSYTMKKTRNDERVDLKKC